MIVEGRYNKIETDVDSLPDGRKVIRVNGEAYVLKEEIYERWLVDSLERTGQISKVGNPVAESVYVVPPPRQPKRNAKHGTMCHVLLGGQLCGGNLTLKGVCPASKMGALGVRAMTTCDTCGTVQAVMVE